MPRRKLKHISASGLECFEQIVSELEARGDFEGYDFSTLALSVKYQVEPTIRPENIKKAIGNIERHIAMNCKSEFDLIVGKSRLAKIAKISRPTMTRWCDDRLIRSGTERIRFPGGDEVLYDLELVVKQLRSMKSK